MDTSPHAAPAPAGPQESHGVGLRIVGHAARLVGIAGFLAWFVPDLLTLAGQPALASRLARDPVLRGFLLPASFALLVAGHVLARAGARDARREARERQAAELGGGTTAGRGLEVASGSIGGPELRLEAAGHPLSVATVTSGGGARGARSSETRAQVAFASDDLFGFQAISHGHAARLVGGLRGFLLEKSMRDALRRAKSDAERRSIESVRYLSGPPLRGLPADVADLCELRSNDAARASALLSASGVPGALRELDRLARSWEWTLYPAKHPGRVEMTVTLPGGGADTETIRAVRTLMGAALEALGEAKAA